MSPYIFSKSAVSGGGGGGGGAANRASSPPVLASIGTVLIDAFDSLPRPVVDPSPPSSSHPSTRSSSPPTSFPLPTIPPPPPHAPTATAAATLAQLPIHIPPHHLRLSPSLSSPTTSGPSTPQLSLEDFPSPNAEDVYEMLGGGGLFALVGARLWLPAGKLRALVDRAPEGEPDDCPRDVERKLSKLGEEMWVWNRGEGTRMTRARIRYEGDVRFFHPVVKAPYRTVRQLDASPLRDAQYLHISPPYSPEDVAALLKQFDARADGWRPKIVFEPTPPSCHPGQKDWLEQILPGIEVLSPNHEELLSIYSVPTMPIHSPELVPTVERLINHILHNVGIGADGNGIVVVRCGMVGACVGTKKGGLKWCPAFWDGGDGKRVKDVTGAGNSFLGGFAAGLSLTNDPYEAALYATVSSSFIVEQFGLPTPTPGRGALAGRELWNGDLPSRRLEDLRKRMAV
ncbi:hypothetical protein IAT38_008352 [Cryptococcus sp. DSM 104549]